MKVRRGRKIRRSKKRSKFKFAATERLSVKKEAGATAKHHA
jgi:hypothetical protein